MTAPAGLASHDYLEALYEMREESIPLVQARLAEWLGVSAASASEAVKRLVRDELVESHDRRLVLTGLGEEVAAGLVRRHRLAEQFLVRIIGLPWHRAHEEAGGWERAISDDVEARIVEILDDPATCPHGNPVPGSSRRVDLSKLVPLNAIPPGGRVVLRRLTEDLELQLDVMRFFEESGLMPGAAIAVHQVAPDGSMSLEVVGRQVALGANLADNLWVEPADPASA
ncbi:MAG: metal-dependent transcriptional regulator [Actinobacteria bacterium]|nr:metal-dependent transcriptional regulator [Actinomycetota bacterium]